LQRFAGAGRTQSALLSFIRRNFCSSAPSSASQNSTH
jgi:hypothetical protein